MMGERRVMQEALFYGFSLERHVPDSHLLRKIDRFVDLSGLRAHLGPYYRVSRPKEFHLRPLSEPDVSLSAHPAPIIHPTTDSPSTNGRMRVADVAPAV